MNQLLIILGNIGLVGIVTAFIAMIVVSSELDKIKEELSDEQMFFENIL